MGLLDKLLFWRRKGISRDTVVKFVGSLKGKPSLCLVSASSGTSERDPIQIVLLDKPQAVRLFQEAAGKRLKREISMPEITAALAYGFSGVIAMMQTLNERLGTFGHAWKPGTTFLLKNGIAEQEVLLTNGSRLNLYFDISECAPGIAFLVACSRMREMAL